jgi:hypothetical protein
MEGPKDQSFPCQLELSKIVPIFQILLNLTITPTFMHGQNIKTKLSGVKLGLTSLK